MALLDDVKIALKEDSTDANTEVQDLIDSAKADLELNGVYATKIVDTDALIKRALVLYCKANYGYEDPLYAEKFLASYISLRNHLVMSTEYSAYDAASES